MRIHPTTITSEVQIPQKKPSSLLSKVFCCFHSRKIDDEALAIQKRIEAAAFEIQQLDEATIRGCQHATNATPDKTLKATDPLTVQTDGENHVLSNISSLSDFFSLEGNSKPETS